VPIHKVSDTNASVGAYLFIQVGVDVACISMQLIPHLVGQVLLLFVQV